MKSLARTKKLLLLLLFAGLAFATCAAATDRQMIDQVGRTVVLPKRPVRIVSLAPAITEMVYTLGCEDRLIGVTRFADYPAAAKEKPRVGSYVRLDLERILALNPDLCLATRDGNPKHTIDKITALGIPVYVIDPRNLEEIIDAFIGLGEVLNVKDQAEKTTKDMRARIQRVTNLARQSLSSPGVFFQIDLAPIISAGTDTFIHQLITMAGGRNLAAGKQPYPRYNWEKLLELQPEIVIITSMAKEQTAPELIHPWQRWTQIPAVRDGQIHVVDANLFGRPTARLVRGLEVLAEIIHSDMGESKNGD